MIVLVMSEPEGSLADNLLQAHISALLCVTQDNVHLRTLTGGIVSGKEIETARSISINLPELKSQLLKAYPLIDRWVSRQLSISTTIELLLEYTTSLIQLIGNHRPHCAVLETGAPHHLFSYSLDAALKYLGIPTYYLYGNAFDGRCIVFNGNEKESHVRVSTYSAQAVVDNYVDQVKRNATYIPSDSSKSLSPFLHKFAPYALYLRLRQTAVSYYNSFKSAGRSQQEGAIKLTLPYVGPWELLSILKAHKNYLGLLESQGPFDIARIREDDIVYVGHMVPEATSCPESPDYPDELDVLLDLKHRFPESTIFYREHPAIALYSEFGHIHFQGLHKCPPFYAQLSRLGIPIIPPSMHISKIRATGCLFATKTGRVAVENSVLGITTLIYGFPFYGRDLPLAQRIDTLPQPISVPEIKARSARAEEPAAVVTAHLVDMFSGSIENPGIGLGTNSSVRSLFDADLILLIKQLISTAPRTEDAHTSQSR